MFHYFRRTGVTSRLSGGKRNITSKVKGFFVTENIPKIGFVIGSCALAVQVMLLYPKHEILSHQFKDVEKIVHRVSAISHALDARLNEILTLEKEIKAKERRILDKENEIYSAELSSIGKINIILDTQAAKFAASVSSVTDK